MITYILTKFGADWSIFVDDREKNIFSQQVSRRMNSHRYDICNFENPAFSSSVATHFNSSDHSLNDLSFTQIDIVKPFKFINFKLYNRMV